MGACDARHVGPRERCHEGEWRGGPPAAPVKKRPGSGQAAPCETGVRPVPLSGCWQARSGWHRGGHQAERHRSNSPLDTLPLTMPRSPPGGRTGRYTGSAGPARPLFGSTRVHGWVGTTGTAAFRPLVLRWAQPGPIRSSGVVEAPYLARPDLRLSAALSRARRIDGRPGLPVGRYEHEPLRGGHSQGPAQWLLA
jgi:hypothetical protein